MYADDLVAVMESRTELKRVLRMIKSWDSRYGLVMNKKKSAVINMNWKKVDTEKGLEFE